VLPGSAVIEFGGFELQLFRCLRSLMDIDVHRGPPFPLSKARLGLRTYPKRGEWSS
jgi:hypothetical protein